MSSLGWAGAVCAFLVLAVSGLSSVTPTLSDVYVAMDAIARFVVLPLCGLSLASGLALSSLSPWGLLQHYWTLVKLGVTTFSAVVLLIHMQPISDMAHRAEGGASAANFRGAQVQLVVASIGALLLLGMVSALGVFKPKGLTRRGWRLRQP
jgi:hypothetical protein